jgi:hypothetical protein
MKFGTVEIRPSRLRQGEWLIDFYYLPGDRVGEGSGPYNLGFYHYPLRMGRKKAFEALRAHMVAKCEEEIEELTKRIGELNALKMPRTRTTPPRKTPSANT